MAESTKKRGCTRKKSNEKNKVSAKKNTSAEKKKATKSAGSRANKFKTKMPENKRFVLSNGKVICSVKELALEMENIEEDVFYYHVNEDKNDFVNWLRDVIEEPDLAQRLKGAKSKGEFQIKLLKYIVKKI